MYSSLYKVDYLKFNPKAKGSLLWSAISKQNNHQNDSIKDQYIWGVELIAALMDNNKD